MSVTAIRLMVFACVFGGALFGMFLRALLPEHQLSADTKDTVRLGMGLIGTMSALVLGLLIASAKGFYDTQNRRKSVICCTAPLPAR
jgi:fluoride ion exporter CrcB/FEX